MTDENKTVETQDVASPAIEDSSTIPEQTDTPEESQMPEESAADTEEAGEEDAVQAEPVHFEEDAAPPAHADEAAVEEEDALVEVEIAQEGPVEPPSEQAVQDGAQEGGPS